MSASPILEKLREGILQLIVGRLLARLNASDWTSCICRIMRQHFTTAPLGTTGENEALAYNAVARILESRPKIALPPTGMLVKLMAEEMSQHSLPTPLTAWVLLFCARDLNTMRKKDGILTAASLGLPAPQDPTLARALSTPAAIAIERGEGGGSVAAKLATASCS